jgi:hypothetical protein
VSTTSFPPCPLRIGIAFLEREKVCVPSPIVRFVVRTPAGTVTVTGALLPLATAKVAGLVKRVVTNMTLASMFIPFGGPSGSEGHWIDFGVVLYQ